METTKTNPTSVNASSQESPKALKIKSDYQKEIMSRISQIPKSAQQISKESGIPFSTVYRNIKILNAKNLLSVSGTTVGRGNKMKLYLAKSPLAPSPTISASQVNQPSNPVSSAKTKPQSKLLRRADREKLGQLPIPELVELLRASATSERAAKSEANLKNLAWYAKRAIAHEHFKHIANPFISNAVAAEKVGLKENTLARLRSSLIKLNAIMSMREAKMGIKPGREELLTLIRENPKISRGALERLGFSYEISKYFGSNISNAREAAKVPFVPHGHGDSHHFNVKEGTMRIITAYSPVRLSSLRNLVPFGKPTLIKNLLLLKEERKIELIRLKVGGRGRSYGFYKLFRGEAVQAMEVIVTDFEPTSLEKLAKMIAQMVSENAKNDSGIRTALGRQLRQMNLPAGVLELIFNSIKEKK